MKYYSDVINIAHVDKKDNVLGKTERWTAHKEGILHRAFTVAVFYQDKVIIQHRKHPVFDSVLDITVSSHQYFKNGDLTDDLTAIYETLERELELSLSDLESAPKKMGSILYKAKDKRSEYIEHEICRVYSCKTKKKPVVKKDFCYDLIYKNMSDLENIDPDQADLAPWVKEMIKKKMI